MLTHSLFAPLTRPNANTISKVDNKYLAVTDLTGPGAQNYRLDRLLNLLKEAMRREDKSFRVYVDLMSKATSPQTRVAAANLAQEEVRHKLLLEIKYQQALAK